MQDLVVGVLEEFATRQSLANFNGEWLSVMWDRLGKRLSQEQGYRDAHRDHVRQKNRESKRRCREHCRAYNREWQRKNRDHYNALQRAWRARQRELKASGG